MYNKLHQLPIEAVQPTGWLKKQLLLQAGGLSKKLFDVWDSTGRYSGWLGGTGEDWERGPYYIDGVLPLAYYTGDKELLDIAMQFINWTLQSQDAEGNFGPVKTRRDWWSRTVMLKVLVQYYEIHKDSRVLDLMERYFTFMDGKLCENPFTQWGAARTADTVYCIQRLDAWRPLACKAHLLEQIYAQSLDWSELFANFPFTRPTGFYYNWQELMRESRDRVPDLMQYHATHIVNTTQGLKFPAVRYWLYGDRQDTDNLRTGIQQLTRYHGVVTGLFNGDEHLSGPNPTQGAELCSIVEYMFSLEIILEVLGDPTYADLLERITYNALPATITEDFMAHQYLQQVNQIAAVEDDHGWFNNTNDANMYGLEPHFGCCTANMHQGWPKLVRGLWYQGNGQELVAMAYAPSTVTLGNTIIEESTDYPFRDRITLTVRNGGNLKLRLRVPGWCNAPELIVNGAGIAAKLKDGFVEVICNWGSCDTVELVLPMELRTSRWYNNSLGIERGPLVYALDLQEDWQVVKTVGGVNDYDVTTPDRWNYAIAQLEDVVIHENPMTAIPFSKQAPPVTLELAAAELLGWVEAASHTTDIPKSPVKGVGAKKLIQLIPYGCTKLRISQFPTLF